MLIASKPTTVTGSSPCRRWFDKSLFGKEIRRTEINNLMVRKRTTFLQLGGEELRTYAEHVTTWLGQARDPSTIAEPQCPGADYIIRFHKVSHR